MNMYIAVYLIVHCWQWLFARKTWILPCCMPSCDFEAKQRHSNTKRKCLWSIEIWLLTGLVIHVAYICSVKIVLHQRHSSGFLNRPGNEAIQNGAEFFKTYTYSQLIVIPNYMEAAAPLWLGKVTITHKLVPPLPAFLVWCKSKGVV